MLYSMTGYGKQIFDFADNRYIIEIKTLNGKNLELNFRLNALFRPYDLILRKLLIQKIQRGSIDCTIVPLQSESNNISEYYFDSALFQELYGQMQPLARSYGVTDAALFQSVLRHFSLTVQPVQKYSLFCSGQWEVLLSVVEKVLEEIILFRQREGQCIADIMTIYLQEIHACLVTIEQHSQDRVAGIQTHLQQKIKAIATELNYMEGRLEQELIYYVERLDISEELSRIKTHLNYFKEVMAHPKEQLKGKKLGFIIQEINREANTIGSKAQNSLLQQQVVLLKDAIEKIKEQLANVL